MTLTSCVPQEVELVCGPGLLIEILFGLPTCLLEMTNCNNLHGLADDPQRRSSFPLVESTIIVAVDSSNSACRGIFSTMG